MSDQTLLSLIHNKNILEDIISEVPFEKLLRISQRNKVLQKIIKISPNIYKKLSQKKNLIYSICLLIDHNKNFRENPSKIISKFLELPFMAFGHIKVLYGESIDFICQVTEKQYTYLLCGQNGLFLSSVNFDTNEVTNLEIKNEKNEKIPNSVYPTKLGEGFYLFNSKTCLYGINLNKDNNNLNANKLFENKGSNELLSITTLTNTNFLVSTDKGECLYFTLDPAFLTVKLNYSIKDKSIFSYLKFNEDIILTYSGNVIYSININKNGEIIEQKIEHEKEIFSLSINKTNEYIASGGIDGTLIIWSINSKGKLKKINCFEKLHSKLIYSILALKNGDFCSCGQDCKLVIFDTKKLTTTITFNKLEHLIGSVIELNDERICVATYDSRITIFNKVTGNIDAIISNIYSIPKYMIENDNLSIITCKYNQCVDIIGDKIENIEKSLIVDSETNSLFFDVNEAF
jgi:WD40 repeat protein